MKRRRRSVLKDGIRIASMIAMVWTTAVSWGCDRSGGHTSVAPTNPPTVPSSFAPSGPTGSYAVTLTASSSCSMVTDAMGGQTRELPEYVRTRRYDGEFASGAATLTATDGTGNRVQIGGTDHYIYAGMPLMSVKGTMLTIIVPPAGGGGYGARPTCAGGDYWWEVLSQGAGNQEVFELCGTWEGTMEDANRIEGTINGSFGYYKGVGPAWSTDLFCNASDHHFTLMKR